jgi:hypothetical protein
MTTVSIKEDYAESTAASDLTGFENLSGLA